jgi:putative ABC transport system permease protein
MDVIASRIASQHPDTNKDWGAKVNLAAEDLVGDIRPTFLVLLGAVLLVLLIACANVANLMLARASSRRKEMAIRLALGAKRSRVIRQLLTESLLLGLSGGALGVLLAYSSIGPLIRLIPETVSFVGIGNIRVDRSALAFSFLVSIVTSILFGLAPAIEGSRADLGKNLSEGGRGSTAGARGGRLRGLLVVSEVVLALVLLIGAGLMLRSFQKLQEVDPGFRQDHVLTMTIIVPANRYSPDKLPALFDRLAHRIEAIPGVISAGITTGLPLRYSEFSTAFTIDGAPVPAPGTEPRSGVQMTSPGYFGTMGIRLLDGRYIMERDIAGAPRVAVINSAMATRYWRGENPIGKRIHVPIMRLPPDQAAVEIVGVVADIRAKGLAVKPEPAAYFTHAQYPNGFGVFAVRTSGSPRSLMATVQREVWEVDRNQPVIDVLTMEEVVSDSMWQLRFSMALLGAFGLTALILAACGLYAVMAYSVKQRTHEIGLRMALGSSSGDVLRLILASALKLALAGVAVGLVVSSLLNRALSTWLEGLGGTTQTVNQWIPSGQRGLLYGLSPTDPLTFAGIAGVLVAVTLIASYIPARRASRLDPMTALRCE